MIRNDRGVALLIALLVTTLLIALVFEFAYGTRISLRAAVNFRDSQRASYLARSGVNFVGKLLSENLKQGKKQANLEQRDWQVVPIVSAGDMELRIRWEDEAGKINIASLSTGQQSLVRLARLFEIKQVSQDVLEQLKEKKKIRLLGELHRLMSDEEFGRIKEYVTVWTGDIVDINTASSEVLQSLGMSASLASLIREKQTAEPFTTREMIANYPGMDPTTSSWLDLTSDVFLVHSYATVGGYTKQAEAVIKRNNAGYTILYWRIV